jgi:hypothetical protein
VDVVDANVLLYAVNRATPRHDQARAWLDNALTGAETVGFTWGGPPRVPPAGDAPGRLSEAAPSR